MSELSDEISVGTVRRQTPIHPDTCLDRHFPRTRHQKGRIRVCTSVFPPVDTGRAFSVSASKVEQNDYDHPLPSDPWHGWKTHGLRRRQRCRSEATSKPQSYSRRIQLKHDAFVQQPFVIYQFKFIDKKPHFTNRSSQTSYKNKNCSFICNFTVIIE